MISDILDIVFWPLESEKRNLAYIFVIMNLLSSTVNNMRYLVCCKKFKILHEYKFTCAIIWSAMNMPSVILVGTDMVQSVAYKGLWFAKFLFIIQFDSVKILKLKFTVCILKSYIIRIITILVPCLLFFFGNFLSFSLSLM